MVICIFFLFEYIFIYLFQYSDLIDDFHKYDKNGDGKLTAQELKEVLKKEVDSLNDEKLNEIIAIVDKFV